MKIGHLLEIFRYLKFLFGLLLFILFEIVCRVFINNLPMIDTHLPRFAFKFMFRRLSIKKISSHRDEHESAGVLKCEKKLFQSTKADAILIMPYG